MPDYTLSAKITADISGFSRSIEAARTTLEHFQKSCSSVGDGLKELGGKIEGIGSVITGVELAIASAVGGIVSESIKTGAAFYDEMAKVSAISGQAMTEIQDGVEVTGKGYEALVKKAKRMGAATRFTATEAGQAFEYMGMASWDAQQMMAGIEGVMNLAAASGENLATTADIVTDSLTAFGYTADDTGMFVDVLAVAATNSNTNVYMMGETFKYVGTVAGALKYNIKDVAVAVGLMANSSVKGSQAGTALRAMLTNLSDPTEEQAEIMERYGISLFEASGEARPFSKVLNQLRDAFSGMTDQQKEANASILAGKYGMSGLLAIVNATDADVTKLTEAIYNSDGACKQMADTMNSTLVGQFEIFKSAVSAVYTSIYELLEPSLMKIVQAGQKVADTINTMLLVFSEARKDGKDVFASISLAFGMVEGMAEHGTIPAYFDQIAEAVRWAADKLSALHEAGVPLGEIALKALAIGPALIAAGTAVSGLGGIIGTAGGIIMSFVGSVTGLSAALPGLMLGLGKLGGSVGMILIAPFMAAISVFKNFGSIFPGLAAKITGVFSTLGGKIAGVFTAIGGRISAVFSSVAPAFTAFFGKIGAVFGKFGAAFSAVVGNIGTIFASLGSAIAPAVKMFQKAFGTILRVGLQYGNLFTSVLMKCFGFGAIGGLVLVGLGLIQKNFGNKISEILSDVQQNAPEIITTFCTGIAEKIPELITQGAELVNNLLQTLYVLTPSLITGGADILIALVTGFAEALPTLIENVGQVVVRIVTSLTEKLPEILAAGMAILGALISGISAVLPTLIPAAVSMILTLATGLIDQLPELIDSGIELVMALAEGLITALPEIAQKVPEIITKLVTTLVEKAPDLLTAAVEIILALTSGLQTALPELIDRIPEMFENIRDAFLSVDWKGIGVSLCELIAQGFVNIVNTVIGVLNSIISSANMIPGVNLPTIPEWIPSFAHGTDNFAGGFALINESGKGEIVNLPNGSQVIPHDISRKYASEAARMNAGASVAVIDYDAIGQAVAKALGDVDIRVVSELDGRTVAEQITPFVDRGLARRNVLAART